jgi:hypothetical protein
MGSFLVVLHDAEGVYPKIALVQEFCQGDRILNTPWNAACDFFPPQAASRLKVLHIRL